MLTQNDVIWHCHDKERVSRDAALIDIAQDHVLSHLHQQGFFARGLVLTGSVALRKYRAGIRARFSPSLEFSTPDGGLAGWALAALSDVDLGGFRVQTEIIDERHAMLRITTPFDWPDVETSVEISADTLRLRPKTLDPIPVEVHWSYGFPMPSLPVICAEEDIVNRLIRFSRSPMPRDLYDLAWYAARPFDEDLVRRLWVLKMYGELRRDGREGPIDPDLIFADCQITGEMPDSDAAWTVTVKLRYIFLKDMTPNEQRWCLLDPADEPDVTQALASLCFR